MNLRNKMIEIQIPAGFPATAGIKLPLRGPYIVMGQHDLFDKETDFNTLAAKFPDNVTEVFNLEMGTAVYQSNGSGGIELVGYLYDTSD